MVTDPVTMRVETKIADQWGSGVPKQVATVTTLCATAIAAIGLGCAGSAFGGSDAALPVKLQSLVAGDQSVGDELGKSVAYVEPFAVAGAWTASSDGVVRHGAAQFWRYAPEGWTSESLVLPPELTSEARFGSAVALGWPYNFQTGRPAAAIGAPGAIVNGMNGAGNVSLFRRDFDGVWQWEVTFTASDPQVDARFGRAVAIGSNRVIVGAPQRNGFRGGVYVFRAVPKKGETPIWEQEALITAADASAGDAFGESVAIAGNRIVVGAWGKDKPGASNQGAVYVFELVGETWTQKAKVFASDGAAQDEMGRVISLDATGATFVAGTTAALSDGISKAHVFEHVGSAWVQTATLTPPTAQANDGFASALSIDDELIIVGAPSRKIGGNAMQGSAFVFARSTDTPPWSYSDEIIDAVGAVGDSLGSSVVLHGEAVVLGARGLDIPLVPNVGSAIAFWMRDCNDDGAFGLCNKAVSDFNSDGLVNCIDLSNVLGNWGAVEPGNIADLDGDGIVDGRDLAILLGQWNG